MAARKKPKIRKKPVQADAEVRRDRHGTIAEIDGREVISMTEAAKILSVHKNGMTGIKKRGELTSLVDSHKTHGVFRDEVERLAKLRAGDSGASDSGESLAELARKSELRRKHIDILKYHAKLMTEIEGHVRTDVVIDDLDTVRGIVRAAVTNWRPEFLGRLSDAGATAFAKEADRICAEVERELSAVVDDPISELEDKYQRILCAEAPLQPDTIVESKTHLNDIKSQIALIERCVMLRQLSSAKVAAFKAEAAGGVLQQQFNNIKGRTANFLRPEHRVGVRSEIIGFVNSVIEQIEGELPESMIAQAFILGFTPPPDWTVSEWADQRRILTAVSSGSPGRWDTSFTPYLREPMDVIADETTERVTLMFAAQTGKALDCSEPILTPTGWRAMGDLKPGDQVFGSDGRPTDVVAVSPVWKDRDCYRVSFHDGTSVVADAEHEWQVSSHKRLPSTPQPWRRNGEKAVRSGVVTTEDIAAAGVTDGKRFTFRVKTAPALQLPCIDLLLDPYVLGYWLGDGTSRDSGITVHGDDLAALILNIREAGMAATVTPQKDRPVFRVVPYYFRKKYLCNRGHDKRATGSFGPHGQCGECQRQAALQSKHGADIRPRDPVESGAVQMQERLRGLGVLREKQGEGTAKRIPHEYLLCDEVQRRALLQGLMDSDGTIARGGCRVSITQKSAGLTADIVALARSLGYLPKVKIRSISGKEYHEITWSVYDPADAFRLQRKIDAGAKPKRTADFDNRRIVAVEPVEPRDTVCIQVAAEDHLFLAGEGLVPTHNSELLLNATGCVADLTPAPVMVLQPTIDMAEQFLRERVRPMFSATPELARKLEDSAVGGKTAQQARLISFAGGYVVGVGANSAASLASRPVKFLVADECDRYPLSAGSEGSPLMLAEKRTVSFSATGRKIIVTSTPTVKGVSVIERLYESSDRRRLFCPCPHCQEPQELLLENLKWEEGHHEHAAYMCPECGTLWTDSERMWSVANGEWIATRPEVNGHAGFFITALHSPFYTAASIAKEYEAAIAGGTQAMRVFTNTVLGEPYRDDSTETTEEGLVGRMDSEIGLRSGNPIQSDVLAITCGVDVQQDRIEAAVLGWKRPPSDGALPVPVVLDHKVFVGQVDSGESWSQLTEFLSGSWQHELGGQVSISMTCIDSGNWANMVYQYADRTPRTYAVKGQTGEGRPLTKHSKSKKKGREKPLIIVGTHEAKDRISAGWLNKRDSSAFVQIASIGDAGECAEWAKQALSEYREVKATSKGDKFEWIRKPGHRAEVLDCLVYAHAAMSLINPAWDSRENELTQFKDDDEDDGDSWATFD